MPKTKKVGPSKKGKKISRKNKTQMGGNLNTQFMDAIMDDNLLYIEDNIGNITDLSFENQDGNTPLEIAVDRYNDLETTEFMGNYERKLELYSIRTQIIEILLENGANGENIEIPGINLNKANLKGVNLKGANLKEANLVGANLEGANLVGANLEESNLEGANLLWANLVEANLEGANLEGAAMDGAIFEETNLNGTDIDEEIFNTQSSSNVLRTTTDLPTTTDNNNGWVDLLEPINRETEQERNERLKRERNEKKQKYLQRPEITLNINNTNPFEKVGLSSYHVFEMEDVNFCDYIREDQDNVIFIYDKQVGMFDKSTIRKLITTETLDETKIVYECNEISEAFVPYEENIISGPMLNMRILAINGLMIPLNELDAVVNVEHQIFVIETENDKNKIPIASLPTRLAMGDDESGRAVVSADHCQEEVLIKVGKLSYIENRVLLDQCPILGKGKPKKTERKKNKTKRIRRKKTKCSRKNKKNNKKTSKK